MGNYIATNNALHDRASTKTIFSSTAWFTLDIIVHIVGKQNFGEPFSTHKIFIA